MPWTGFLRVAVQAWPALPPAPRETMLAGVRRLDDEAPTELPQSAGAAVTVVVCETCRDASGSEAHPRPGALLAEATRRAAAGTRIATARVECLGNCKRRLSAAMLRPGAWSYVFGDLTVGSAADLVAGALLFADSEDGLIPWRGRPDSLKRGLVARIPPLSHAKVDR